MNGHTLECTHLCSLLHRDKHIGKEQTKYKLEYVPAAVISGVPIARYSLLQMSADDTGDVFHMNTEVATCPLHIPFCALFCVFFWTLLCPLRCVLLPCTFVQPAALMREGKHRTVQNTTTVSVPLAYHECLLREDVNIMRLLAAGLTAPSAA